MKTKTLAISGIIAALYVAVSLLIAPFAFGALQFRIAEMFNHLIVFNKKYFFGIVLGVIVTNFFSPLGLYDLAFGVAHSIISLSLTILASKFIKGYLGRMIFNTLIFSFMMFIIAFELKLVFIDIKDTFLELWLTVAIGEFVVLAVGIALMIALNKRLNFKSLI
ncbi:QueT transporter family protein [Psychrobacillus sp. NPDC093180]|uniref:QueT transporter family protein n=1 Tax=Psychrobacillus sp. NPDC093180 TaxID=3364489 RepID=UPI003800447E